MSRYIEADNAIERLGAYLMADAQIEYGGMASEDINDWKELASDILKGTPSIDLADYVPKDFHDKTCEAMAKRHTEEIQRLMPKRGEWIPCSKRLPEDIRPVLVTWKNTDPASYYQYIVGKHFIGTAHYHRGKWYWYSSVTEDLLAEYGKCDSEEFDEAIEAVAWMPLPEPYEEREGE